MESLTNIQILIDQNKHNMPENDYILLCQHTQTLYHELNDDRVENDDYSEDDEDDDYDENENEDEDDTVYEDMSEIVHTEIPQATVDPLTRMGIKRARNSYNLREIMSTCLYDRRYKFIIKIQEFLHKLETTYGKDMKCEVVDQMYNFMLENRWFIEKHKLFRETTRQKLSILVRSGYNREKALYYYDQLYQTPLV